MLSIRNCIMNDLSDSIVDSRTHSYFSDVLAIDPTSVRSNIDVAKIYSSILPNAHRDNAFALVCIERALLFHPTSSKANHRMGVLLISTVSAFRLGISTLKTNLR